MTERERLLSQLEVLFLNHNMPFKGVDMLSTPMLARLLNYWTLKLENQR